MCCVLLNPGAARGRQAMLTQEEGKNNHRPEVVIVGHAHVDAVWLWDRTETKEVLTETFERVLGLMEKYPDVTFAQTSAQYFEWLEIEQPGLFGRIRSMIAEGRWEIVGGMWIEPDCNMPSGESLCRQLLAGMRYFQRKFDVSIRVAWLPDVFGFAWTLPQILHDAGIRSFFTSKLIWQTRLPFPHNVFWWESPDGSRVLGYQTPGLYNNVDVYEVNKQATRFFDGTSIGCFLAPFGEGDHGGGLREELVEAVHRNPYPVQMRFGNAHEYFDNLERLLPASTPVVRDELYLNTHRGTLTTQAFMKRANRRGESAILGAETMSVLAMLSGTHTPDTRSLSGAWKHLLFNQFHDALPGSSIKPVYEDARQDFAELFDCVETVMTESIAAIARSIDTSAFDHPIVVFNPLGWDRSEFVRLVLTETPETTSVPDRLEVVDSTGHVCPSYVRWLGSEHAELWFRPRSVPAFGYSVHDIRTRTSDSMFKSLVTASADTQTSDVVIENELVRVTISGQTGIVTSLFDKRLSTECAGSGGIGDIELYQDETTKESAWNICRGRSYAIEMAEPPSLVEQTNQHVRVATLFRFAQTGRKDSVFRVCVTLCASDPLVYFETHIDWNAEFVTSRVRFDLAGLGDSARYEIPYGAIDRRDPTSPDANPYEREKWEVSAQTWISCPCDEGARSTVLLNDSKYGFAQAGSNMYMTLLRSPHYPNPTTMGLTSREDGPTDQGPHTIAFALYSVASGPDTLDGALYMRGKQFNTPMQAFYVARKPSNSIGSDRSMIYSLLKVSPEALVATACKISEDSDGIVVRLLECNGEPHDAEITLGFPFATAERVNILETPSGDSCEVRGQTIRTHVKPHQLVTILIRP